MERSTIACLALAAMTWLSAPAAMAREVDIEIHEIPEGVLAAARRELPGFVPVEAEIETEKSGRRVYEIDGTASGSSYEVEVLPDGTIVSVELKRSKGKRSSETSAGARMVRTASSPIAPSSARFVASVEMLDLPVPESEIVTAFASDASGGIAVVSPGAACGGEGEHSSLVLAELLDPSPQGRPRFRTIDLGLGESTSVAAHPEGAFFLVAMKDPVQPNVLPGRVAIVAGHRVVRFAAVGPGPDSIAISPDASLAVVACEASAPDPEECEAEDPAADVPGSIHVLDLRGGPESVRTIAVVQGEDIFRRFLLSEPERAGDERDVEPEYAAVAPDSSLALVSLQEQSAIVTLDLRDIHRSTGKTPEDRGREILSSIVLLPHGELDDRDEPRGVHPDGLAISPDGTFAISANEAHSRARHLQGISVIDLQGGPDRARLVATHPIFDLDPTLLGTRLAASRGAKRLPRIDPEGVTILDCGDRRVAAVALERKAPGEEAGSVLFLDLSGVLEGRTPLRVDRRIVGVNRGSRPEGIVASRDGRAVYVAVERDGGTLTRIGIVPDAARPSAPGKVQ
ncbi:MAG: hypothetical protein JXA90_16005 [Planctomycetes bacterium]|nr:hypothetical protein [Planctomycetota bacterium]